MSSPQTGREWRTSPAEYVHRATSSMPARLKPQKPETLQLIASASNWCTGKDSNLRTSLGGTDLQSVGFNHSPTCAKPSNSADNSKSNTPTLQPCDFWETNCRNSRCRLDPPENTLNWSALKLAPRARLSAQTFRCFRKPFPGAGEGI